MTVATRFRLWLSPAVALVTCCNSSGLTAVRADGDRIPLRIVKSLRQPDSSQTPVTIGTASITGDTLHLLLLWAGGCGGPHEFGLAASSHLTESDPPHVTVIVRHDGHGDSCRAGWGRNVVADLRPLQTIVGDQRTLRVRLYEPWALVPVEARLVYSF